MKENQAYDLAIFSMGSGFTLYNRNKTRNGEYQQIANISPLGKIQYYEKNLPDMIKRKVEDISAGYEFEYREFIVRKYAYSATQGVYYILANETRELLLTCDLMKGKDGFPQRMTDAEIKYHIDYLLKNNHL